MTEEDGYFEKLCNARMCALRSRIETRLDAMDKAIDKAEVAQRDYNTRSNEFRGQLDDQAKTLMPRNETAVLVRTLEEKIAALDSTHDARFIRVNEDIASLREYRSSHSGEGTGREAVWGNIFSVVALLLSLVSLISILVRTW